MWSAISSAPTTRSASSNWWSRPHGRCGASVSRSNWLYPPLIPAQAGIQNLAFSPGSPLSRGRAEEIREQENVDDAQFCCSGGGDGAGGHARRSPVGRRVL